MLKHPWSILAYQLGGEGGLKILSGSSSLKSEEEYPPTIVERDTRPAIQGWTGIACSSR